MNVKKSRPRSGKGRSYYDDMVAYMGLQQVCMWDLGANVCIMWALRTFFVQFILCYAFRAKACNECGMVCCCIDMKHIGCWGSLHVTYGLSFVNLLSLVTHPYFPSFQVRELLQQQVHSVGLGLDVKPWQQVQSSPKTRSWVSCHCVRVMFLCF